MSYSFWSDRKLLNELSRKIITKIIMSFRDIRGDSKYQTPYSINYCSDPKPRDPMPRQTSLLAWCISTEES